MAFHGALGQRIRKCTARNDTICIFFKKFERFFRCLRLKKYTGSKKIEEVGEESGFGDFHKHLF
jgi:hypothetical protein